MASDSAPFAEDNFDSQQMLEDAPKFTTLDALDIEADDSEPPKEVWGGLRLAPGQLMEVIGGSGIGKSRMMLNLAINQVLGRDFAGLPTCKEPLNWLFYGNENGFYRFRNDLRQMLKFCTADERERLRGHIFLPTMSSSLDAYVSFTDEENRGKLKTTIQYRNADVVVFDPWGAVIHGDELDDGDVRNTIREIVEVLAAIEGKPTVGIILNHSRNGYKEFAAAAGFEGANYGKNSKAIFTVMRNVWNLRPAHFGEPVTKIEMIHAKSSDFAAYPPRAVNFDPNTFTYRLDPDFDHEIWQYELERAKRSGSSMTAGGKAVAQRKKLEDVLQKVVKHVTDIGGSIGRADLEKWMETSGIEKNQRETIYSTLIRSGQLVRVKARYGNNVTVGTPEAIDNLLKSSPPDKYIQKH